MPEEINRADRSLRDFYDRYIAALNAHNLDIMGEFIHDEVTLNGEPGTRETVQKALGEEMGAVPDLHWVLQKLIVSGNRLGAQLVNTGTPVKEFADVAPTGASFKITEYAVYTVHQGRFRHMAALHDAEELKRQLSA
jgi:predicted ester cyclase